MPTISVRISEEEKKRLLKYGALSSSVREALNLYLDRRKSQELIAKLERLQRNDSVRTSSVDEVNLIHEDRGR